MINNNKGMTLLELLIAIFILTTVIFIGYNIINQSTKSVKNQGNISNGQLSMNDINKYMTMDLEQTKSIKLSMDNTEIADTFLDEKNNADYTQDMLGNKIEYIKEQLALSNKVNYDYRLRFSNDDKESYTIKYEIQVNKTNENTRYTISRIDKNGVKVEFVSDAILKSEDLPFTIQGCNPYTVKMGYNAENNKFRNHKFTIASRLNNVLTSQPTPDPEPDPDPEPNPDPDPEPPKPEEIIPPLDWGDYYVLGFWTADNKKKKQDNLYTWVSDHGKLLGEAYANQDLNKIEKFNIEGYARPGNNKDTSSYIGYKTIDTDQTWNGQVKKVEIGDKDISKISIYISPHTTIEDFIIKGEQGNVKIEAPELKEGWNHCTIEKKGNSKVNFTFKGKLSIDKSKVSSGFAYIIYGKEASYEASGDLVYKWERGKKEYNVEAYSTVGNDKNVRKEIQHNENRNMSIQIDKGSAPPVIRARGLNSEIATSDIEFKDIKSMKLTIEGKLVLKNIKFNGVNINNLNKDNPSVILELDNNKLSNNLDAEFNFSDMKKDKDVGNLIIDFIY